MSGSITSTANAGINGNATAYGLYAAGALNGGDASTPLALTGTVAATANGTAAAVYSGGGLNLHVTGSLSGTDTTGNGNGYAIKSASADDTVTLDAGATLVGKVDLGRGTNTLNLVNTGSFSNQFLNITRLVVGDGTTATNWTLDQSQATASTFGNLTVNPNASVTINEYANVTGNIVDNGSLTFNVASTLTYGGVISGTGSLTKSGSGSLTLTGANTYSGGNILSGGTLNVASIDVLGTGSITYAGGTLLINGVDALQTGFSVPSGGFSIDTATTGNTTVAGAFSGSGTITKTGSGIATLTGDSSSYTGTLQVNSGKVQIASGASMGGTVAVEEGGTVGGYGTVGNLTNRGTVSPGGSIGTLNVAGNYTQAPSSTYYDEITTGSGDLLNVAGTATLSGGRLSIQATRSFYNTGTIWRAITATGGLTGTFASVTQNIDSSTLRFVPLYTSNAVLVAALRVPYSAYAVDGRSASVGSALYRASYTAITGSDMANLLTSLDYSPAAMTTATLQMLSPEPYDTFTQTFFDSGRVLTAAQRSGLHDGGIDGSQAFAGPADAGPATLLSMNGQTNLGQPSGLGSSADRTTSTDESRFSVFLRPFGMLAHQQARSEQTGYEATTGGLTGGVAFRPVSGLTLALAPAFMSQYVDLKSVGGGNGTTSDWSLALMAAYRPGDWFVDGLVRLGIDTTIANRNIPVPGMNRSARAVWNSFNTTASVGGGYDFHVGTVTMGPIASAEWSTLSQQRYRESRAGGMGLRVNARSDASLTTTLGGRAFKKFETSFGAVTPEVRAAWGAQWLDSPRTISASFCGSPDSGFSTKTAGHGYHSGIVDAGVTANIGESFSASARVGAELFRPGYDSQAASLSLKYSF